MSFAFINAGKYFLLYIFNADIGFPLSFGNTRSRWFSGQASFHSLNCFIICGGTSTTRFATVTTGEEGTEVYLGGQLVSRKKDLTLKIPNDSKTRLLLGNSVYGKQPWQGDIYGLAFYGYTLSAQDAAFHFDRWVQVQNFSFAKKEKPFVLYVFDEKVGERAIDHAGGKNHLKIPSRIHILEKKILSPAWTTYKFNRIFIQDIIANLIGFIPFGFFLTATLIKLGGAFEKHDVLITVSFCFAVSLIIEIFQAWIPSRHSDTWT